MTAIHPPGWRWADATDPLAGGSFTDDVDPRRYDLAADQLLRHGADMLPDVGITIMAAPASALFINACTRLLDDLIADDAVDTVQPTVLATLLRCALLDTHKATKESLGPVITALADLWANHATDTTRPPPPFVDHLDRLRDRIPDSPSLPRLTDEEFADLLDSIYREGRRHSSKVGLYAVVPPSSATDFEWSKRLDLGEAEARIVRIANDDTWQATHATLHHLMETVPVLALAQTGNGVADTDRFATILIANDHPGRIMERGQSGRPDSPYPAHAGSIVAVRLADYLDQQLPAEAPQLTGPVDEPMDVLAAEFLTSLRDRWNDLPADSRILGSPDRRDGALGFHARNHYRATVLGYPPPTDGDWGDIVVVADHPDGRRLDVVSEQPIIACSVAVHRDGRAAALVVLEGDEDDAAKVYRDGDCHLLPGFWDAWYALGQTSPPFDYTFLAGSFANIDPPPWHMAGALADVDIARDEIGPDIETMLELLGDGGWDALQDHLRRFRSVYTPAAEVLWRVGTTATLAATLWLREDAERFQEMFGVLSGI